MADLSATAEHDARLQHHFDSYAQQREASTLGMWMFLVTEIMFFGGLFVVYIYYRYNFPEAAKAGSHELDITLGAVNTAILIGSSLTMALAVRSAQLARAKRTVAWLAGTIVLGCAFLGIKVVEYSHKFHDGLYPGSGRWSAGGALEQVHEMFFSIYFSMTGLHALHMIIGVGVLAWLMIPAWKGVYDEDYHNPVECAGLYWHFVDIVWIFLFPLLYLIGRH